MLASELRPEQFKGYPPQARAIAIGYVDLLRRLPTLFVAILLREVIEYDWKFPVERKSLDWQLHYLSSLSQEQLRKMFADVAGINLEPALEQLNWANDPERFSQSLSMYLWRTHQIDRFRGAAMEYAAQLRSAEPVHPQPIPQLGISVIGRGVAEIDFPLFRKLRPHGVLFTYVKPENGWQVLLDAVSERAAAHPSPYSHWYIEGAKPATTHPQIACVSYDALQPARTALLHKMRQIVESGSGSPEVMEMALSKIRPEQLGMTGASRDGVLDHFQANLLTKGSGTQIFSTTFVQWAAREALRRAQPLTLLAHFTPRQRQKPMNELLQAQLSPAEMDPRGSIVDADMGSYYIWLDQQRMPGNRGSSFLVWFEGHNQALGIGPGLPPGSQSNSPATLGQLLQWVS